MLARLSARLVSETWVILCCTHSGVAVPPCPSPHLPQGDLCPLFSTRTRHGREGCPGHPRLCGGTALRRGCPTQFGHDGCSAVQSEIAQHLGPDRDHSYEQR